MILADKTLKTLIRNGLICGKIEPVQIQPASIDLRINETLTIPAKGTALASTIEYIQLPRQYAGRVEGRSTYGRLFLMIHSTAGFIDPGFMGNITLEIINYGDKDYTFERGDRVCQLVVETLDTPCETPYGTYGLGSHYQGQTGIKQSYLKEE